MKSLKFMSFKKRDLITLFSFTIIVQIIYLLGAFLRYRIGFPLDDAWIHQTYARNLIESGSWSYTSGQISGGSTSPLWTLLLVPGHLFNSRFYYFWTFGLSTFIFFLSAIVFDEFVVKQTSKKYSLPIWGLFFLAEWHFVWSANSGMETSLYILIILYFFYLLREQQTFSIKIGIILGIAVWVRPDAITLLGPFFLVSFIHWLRGKVKLTTIIKPIVIFLVILIIYLIFNLLITGTIFPNTFYAKQAEYEILYNDPILFRFLEMAFLPLVGAGIVLLPGWIFLIVKNKLSNLIYLVMDLWLIGYVILYAVRLPVTYQHGRYLIPAMAVYLLTSLIGSILLIEKLRGNIGRIVKRVLIISATLVLGSFFVLGAKAYADDVAIIESEMVDTARWIDQHLPGDAIIAAHDIGALGFWGHREIIDLAGLISPEIIPFMREEKEIEVFLDEQEVDYLMTFPNWYPELIKDRKVVYHSTSKFSPNAGGENMFIYLWE